MAYVSTPRDDDPNKPVTISNAGGSGPSAGGASTTAAPRAPSTMSGSGFTNINAYLTSAANKAGAEQMGQQVAGDIGREVGEAETAIASGRQNFQSQAEANTTPFNQQALSDTLSTGTASAPVQRMLAGTYGGPSSLADVGARDTIDRETREATQKAELASTQGGRAEYLRQLTGRPQTIGVSRLNTALLSGNEQAIGRIGESARQAGTLGARVGEAETFATGLAEQGRATNAATRDRTIGGITSHLDSQDASIAQALQDLQSGTGSKAAQARFYLQSIGALRYDRQPDGIMTIPRTPTRAESLAVTPTTENRAMIASAPAPVEGRATIQRAQIPRDVWMGANEPDSGQGVSTPPAPAPAPAAPSQDQIVAALRQERLIPGWEAMGLTEEQARELQVAARLSQGGQDLTSYLTTPNPETFGRGAVTSASEAARLSALAQLVGRSGYQSMAPNTNINFGYQQALAALQGNRYTPPPAVAAPAPVSTGVSPGGVPVVSVPGGGQPASAPVYPTTPVADVVYDQNTGTPVSVGGVPITAAPNQGVPGGRTTNPNNGDDGNPDQRRPAPVAPVIDVVEDGGRAFIPSRTPLPNTRFPQLNEPVVNVPGGGQPASAPVAPVSQAPGVTYGPDGVPSNVTRVGAPAPVAPAPVAPAPVAPAPVRSLPPKFGRDLLNSLSMMQ